MMDYKKAYYSLIERLKEAKEDADVCDERYCCVIDGLIQEQEESERIRKAISQCVEDMRGQFEKLYSVHHKDAISWLEKQGNKPKQTSIWKHWKDGIAGNGEGEPIYLVKNGNTYSLSSCRGCECDYIELSELDKLMLEKQGEQKPAWSVKDEAGLGDALWAIQQARTIAKDENDMGNLWYAENWLNSLKERLLKS